MEKGVKHSESKPPVGKLFKQFPNALKAVAMCSLFGHLKYEEHDKDWLNYRRVEGQDYLDAMARHLLEGEGKDEQSNLPHKFHVAWNALADLEKYITGTIGEGIFNHSNKDIIEAWRNQFRKIDHVDEYDKK